ncbi:MAG: cob(I)yrinic acid a,c-diamide adenosyltransferase [Thermoleophilia bacterium]|nr:cob(I)yrinic acid a,c-diamide adenosyltransferase [Thermoleophilia bacterium]
MTGVTEHSAGVGLDARPFAKGLVQIYTGNGKGKTTAALGLALRAAGHGLRVYFGQFMKGVPYGELSALVQLPSVTIRQFGAQRWTHPEDVTAEDRALAQVGLQECTEVLHSGGYDVVVLDEINVAAAWGLLPVDQVACLVLAKPAGVELILTGRYVPERILRLADLVTEMNEIKHPFSSGITSRQGIEF